MNAVNSKRYLLAYTLGVLITDYLQTGRQTQEGQEESLERIYHATTQLGLGFTPDMLAGHLRSLENLQDNLGVAGIEQFDREILSALGREWRDDVLRTCFELGRAFGYLVFVDFERLRTSDEPAISAFHTMLNTVVEKLQQLRFPRRILTSLRELDERVHNREIADDDRPQLHQLNENIATYLLGQSWLIKPWYSKTWDFFKSHVRPIVIGILVVVIGGVIVALIVYWLNLQH